MATLVRLGLFLLLASVGLSRAQDDTETQETTTHTNPHIPVTPVSETEEQTIYHSNLYKGRPLVSIQFGRQNRSRVTPTITSTHPSNQNTFTAKPNTGSRWVYHGGRWTRPGSDSTSHTDGIGNYHGDASGYGHDRMHGHHIHVDSSETNDWKHFIHNDLHSGHMHKQYSKTSDNSGHSSSDDSSSSSGNVSGGGHIHGSSSSGESGSTGSGEHPASGIVSD